MNCDQTQPLLEAFADGELGRLQAWRVRHHLAACPVCAAELAETRQLDSRVCAWRDVTAPAALQSRLAAALPSLPTAAALPPRRVQLTRRAAVGMAGMAAAAATFFWLLPGQPGRPTIAFADVEQAMQQVQTISWKNEEQTNKWFGHKSEKVKITFTYWLRCNPAAIAETDFKMTPSDDFHLIKTLTDTRGVFSLSKGECDVYSRLKVSAQQRVEKQIQSLTLFPQTEDSSHSLGQGQSTISNFLSEPCCCE